MKSLLIIRHIEVENANAIAGMTWGFPAISNFLGFAHSLSRKLEQYCGLALGGCAVVCHKHSVQAYQPTPMGDYVFALTRNPLTKDGKSPSFVEEGRMHMEITLLVECDFKLHQLSFQDAEESPEAQIEYLENWLHRQSLMLRLAGGNIKSIERVQYEPTPQENARRLRMQLLPGYFLVDRRDALKRHHESRLEEDHYASLLDSWMDFFTMRYRATIKGKDKTPAEGVTAEWSLIPKPAGGWLVPISVGYKAISPLYQPGEVQRTRDPETPFCFVESTYSIGQWISPHRIGDLSSAFWYYRQDGDWYFCQNNFSAAEQNPTFLG